MKIAELSPSVGGAAFLCLPGTDRNVVCWRSPFAVQADAACVYNCSSLCVAFHAEATGNGTRWQLLRVDDIVCAPLYENQEPLPPLVHEEVKRDVRILLRCQNPPIEIEVLPWE